MMFFSFFNLFILAGIFLVLVFLIFLFVLWKKKKKLSFFSRGMNLALFLVTLPQETEAEKETSLEEYLQIAEQFYSSLAGLKEKRKIRQILLGNPQFVFEVSVPRIGEEIYFYVASPRSLADLVEKQILGFWPKAQIQSITDYNIFNPQGVSLGSEAVLNRSFILPLKTSQEFKMDPLSSITSVLTKLKKEGEGAAIQFLIRPSRKSLGGKANKVIGEVQKGVELNKALSQSQGGFFKQLNDVLFPVSKEKQKEPEEPKTSSLPQESITAITQKSSSSLFDVNLRLISSAEDKGRAEAILGELESAFEQFNSPVLNSIKFLRPSKRKLKNLFYRFSFRIFKEKRAMLLSSKELASLFHFPAAGLLTPYLKRTKAKQAPAPTDLPQEGIVIGENVFRGQKREVRISDKDRGRHFYIIGQTGTGKSALLQEMVRQDIEAGKGTALIDPHGDLAEKVLETIPSSRAEDVIYFDPSDGQRPIGLNMLDYDKNYPESKTFVVNELIEIFEKLYNLKTQGFGGPIFEQYMRNSLLLAMEDPASSSTLIEIPRILADASFRKLKLSRCQNMIVKNFWEKEAEKAGGEAALANMVPYITSKLNIFIANDLVRPIISQQKSSFKFREIMDQGKILIVNLSKGKLGDINSYLLGMIIVGKILIAAFSRAGIPEEQRKDFYLYIDEFHNVTTSTITSILAEARKYRLNMVFGHQFIDQLGEDTRKAVFGNVGSMLALRVGPEDAKYLASQYEPVFAENDLVNFDNYNGALRLLIEGETSKPFNIITFPPKKGDPRVAELIKKFSRAKYGRDRARVESELSRRLEPDKI